MQRNNPLKDPRSHRSLITPVRRSATPLKQRIQVTRRGRIIHVSKSRPGSMHDFELHKTEPPIPKQTRAFVDSGYQGLDKLHTQIELPYKATKTRPLGEEEKEYNQALSRLRVAVEHILGDIKTFRILADRYRNKCKRYDIKFKIIAGIVNLKNGFASA